MEIMERVIIESPYAGDIERNTEYARACLRDSLLRGEAPLASHLLYTQENVLDEHIKHERDLGMSPGMTNALIDKIQERKEHGIRVEFRKIL